MSTSARPDTRPGRRTRRRWDTAVRVAVTVAVAALAAGCDAGAPRAAQTSSSGSARSGPEVQPEGHTSAVPVPWATEQAQARADATNVVVLMLDDLPASLVRYMPTVQRMQRRGVTLVHYFVASPLCCPARVSWLRGQYPHNHGVLSNDPPLGGWSTFHASGGESDTLAVDLASANYETGEVGKYLNGYNTTFVPPGWSWWRGTDGGYDGYYYFITAHGRLERSPRYFSDEMGILGRRFLARAGEQKRPFYLQVNLINPHSPFRPAPRDEQLFPGLTAPRTPNFGRLPRHAPRWMVRMAHRRQPATAEMDRVYRLSAQSVQSADRVLAGLIRTARRVGVLDHTVFVFTADQGARVGEHGLGVGKNSAGDEVTREPLIAMGPGIPKGVQVGGLASEVDWRATVDDLAGLPAPPATDGVSLVPLLHGKTPRDWQRTVLFEHRGGTLLPTDPDYEPRAGRIPTFWAAQVRIPGTARRLPRAYTYVVAADGSRELYVDDRWQLVNRAGELDARTRRRMDRIVMRLAECSGSACRTIGDSMPADPLHEGATSRLLLEAPSQLYGDRSRPCLRRLWANPCAWTVRTGESS